MQSRQLITNGSLEESLSLIREAAHSDVSPPSRQVLVEAADACLERFPLAGHNHGGGIVRECPVAHDAVQQDETSAVDARTEQRGNGATQREAKDYWPRQAQHRDQLAQIIDVLIQRVAGWRLVAEPMPTEIGGHEP